MTDVCVVGLGKIGLPLACAIGRAGHRVRGADISDRVVEQVNAAQEPFPGEAGLADALSEAVGAGRLTATTDTTAAVRDSGVVIIVVPLMVDEKAQPDFGAMDAATAAVARGLQPGTLVSYETTLPVGSTRNRFAPALAAESGLQHGEDLFVIHSPERVFSGRIFEDLRRYPKLVGGIDEKSARRGVDFYESFLEFDDRPDLDRPNGVWDLGTAEAAELAKLAETTYRDINIAYANELAVAAEGIGVDIYRVIEACNSQPFSHIHSPGISVGGHCIPVYPHFLLGSVSGMRLPALARSVNSEGPARAVSRLAQELGALTGMVVGVLGLAYRGGVKEDAFSGGPAIVAALERRGASVLLHDPLYGDDEIRSRGFVPLRLGESSVDAVIVNTDHDEYRRLEQRDLPNCRGIIDGRAVLDPARFELSTIFRIGFGSRLDGSADPV